MEALEDGEIDKTGNCPAADSFDCTTITRSRGGGGVARQAPQSAAQPNRTKRFAQAFACVITPTLPHPTTPHAQIANSHSKMRSSPPSVIDDSDVIRRSSTSLSKGVTPFSPSRNWWSKASRST